MYMNDSVKFLINGTYSEELWLTQGVKQGKITYTKPMIITLLILGCNLSPLFFCLFINNLGMQLNSSNLGITLDNITISAIFFADDIVLIGKSKDALDKLMETTITFFTNHRLQISESKSKIMRHNAVTGKTTFKKSDKSCSFTLDQVLSFKYLGVPVNCSPYNLFKSFNEQVKKKAKNYLSNVLSLVRSGPDRSDLGYTLWTRCALPAIL